MHKQIPRYRNNKYEYTRACSSSKSKNSIAKAFMQTLLFMQNYEKINKSREEVAKLYALYRKFLAALQKNLLFACLSLSSTLFSNKKLKKGYMYP